MQAFHYDFAAWWKKVKEQVNYFLPNTICFLHKAGNTASVSEPNERNNKEYFNTKIFSV